MSLMHINQHGAGCSIVVIHMPVGKTYPSISTNDATSFQAHRFFVYYVPLHFRIPSVQIYLIWMANYISPTWNPTQTSPLYLWEIFTQVLPYSYENCIQSKNTGWLYRTNLNHHPPNLGIQLSILLKRSFPNQSLSPDSKPTTKPIPYPSSYHKMEDLHDTWNIVQAP